jgi:hypothetical protein
LPAVLAVTPTIMSTFWMALGIEAEIVKLGVSVVPDGIRP